MNDEDLNKLRTVIKQEVTSIVHAELEPIKKTLAKHTQILDEHTQILDEHSQKLNALTVDVIELQDTAKAVWDKFSLVEEKQKREIREIKKHLRLPIHID